MPGQQNDSKNYPQDSILIDFHQLLNPKWVPLCSNFEPDRRHRPLGLYNISISSINQSSSSNKIIDPFPTPFSSGGFDLDAVAILGVGTTVNKVFGAKSFPYPNPTSSILNFDFEGVKVFYDILGNEILTTSMSFIDLSNLPNGVYFVTYESERLKIIKI